MDRFAKFLSDDAGATAIEYCFIAGLISIAIVGGLTPVGTKLLTYFSNISTHLN